MARLLDLWVHELGQYKAITNLCIPQHQAEVSDCADKGIPASTAKRVTNHTIHVNGKKVQPLLIRGQLCFCNNNLLAQHTLPLKLSLSRFTFSYTVTKHWFATCVAFSGVTL